MYSDSHEGNDFSIDYYPETGHNDGNHGSGSSNVILVSNLNEPQCQTMYLLTCAPNEDSDQFARMRKLI